MMRVTVTIGWNEFYHSLVAKAPYATVPERYERFAAELRELTGTAQPTADELSHAFIWSGGVGHPTVVSVDMTDAEAIMFKMVHGDGPFTIELAPC